MKTSYFYLFFAFAMVLFVASPIQASDLFFAPKRVHLSDTNPVTEIRVTNQSDIAKSFSVSAEDIIMTEEGVTARVDEFEYSARRMLRFVPRQFELPPGGKQTVRIMARIPSDKPDGQYHSHLKFVENTSRRAALNPIEDKQERARALAQVSFSTAIPISLIKGDVQTTVDMSNARIEMDKKGQPLLAMDLNRSGNGQGNFLLDIEYVAPNGTATKIGARRTVYVYREIDRRKYSTPLILPGSNTIQQGGKVNVVLFNKDKSETDPIKELSLPIE